MTLRDDNLRATLHKVLGDVVADLVKNARQAHLADLTNSYDDTGTKSFDVRLPNGVKVATVSLSIPKEKVDVTDPDVLLEHLQNVGYGWLLKIVEHPAVPEHVVPAQDAWDEVVINGDRLAEWLTAVKPVDKTEPGPVVDPDTGEVVPGVTYTPAADPSSYSVRPTPDGRDEVLRAWRGGELDHLTDGSVLPALAPATQREAS